MSPEERLSRLIYFQGYGDYENSRFLYIGIEEGLAYKTENELEDVLRDYSNKDSPWEKHAPEKPKNITERMQARLSISLLEKYGEHPNENVDNYDLSAKNEFCANIYPFGAESQDKQPDIYHELFNVEKKVAQSRIEVERKKIIKEMILDFVKRDGGLVFIFGKRAHDFLNRYKIWEELSINFLGNQIKFEGNKPYSISYSTNLKVWLTGHPSHSWFTALLSG